MALQLVPRGIGVGMTLAGVACGLAIAQGETTATSATYSIRRYTVEQGLPQNSIRALLQTRDGYLWVGTLAGLARFDGVRFKVFDMNNTPELVNDAINALAQDRQDDSLWINSGQGLLRYHQHRFERFDEAEGYPQPFGPVWPARQGGLWYSPHPGQLVRLQNRAVRTWQLRPRRVSEDGNEIVGHRITRVDEGQDGILLVLMHTGLFEFEPATGGLRRLGLPGTGDTAYRDFARQADRTVLVAARDGLWQLREPTGDKIEAVAPGDPQCPAQIHPANDGAWWIRWSEDGPPRLSRFQGGRSAPVDLSGLPNHTLNAFCEDAEGQLWLGTESGLCQLRPNAVRMYGREHGLRNDFVRTVTAGPDGTVWLGTSEGVSAIKDGQVTNLPPIEPPANWGWAEGLLADRRGRVWYGGRRNTVVAYERGAWAAPAPLSLGESWVRTLYEDRQGRIWAGFDQGVLWLEQTGTVQPFPHKLSHPDVRVIHQDRRGDLWFGTFGGGLNRLRDGQITAYATPLGEYNNRAWWIHEDADGLFWVGSRHGLNRFVPPGVDEIHLPRSEARPQPGPGSVTAAADGGARYFTFTTRHGLYENIVNNIQEDDFGYLWLSGLKGIYRVARRELNDVANGHQSQALVIAFGEADGMANSQCNGGATQPSGCKDSCGRIWFPTARGVAMVDPRTIRRNEVPPPVVVEQVVADDQVIFGDAVPTRSSKTPSADGSRRMSNRQLSGLNSQLEAGRARGLEIRYTANSFAAPQWMQFKYQLEGYDPQWRLDAENRRVAFYTSLRPGTYRFRVTACNNHGVWSAVPAEFAFTLAPHFWQTRLFAVLASAAVIGLAAAVQGHRLRWQRRLLTAERQQALADERTRIARDLHDDLGTALTGLALQFDVFRRDAEDRPKIAQRLGESAARLRGLAERMRQVVWAVNPQCDTVSSLASFLEQQAGYLLRSGNVRCRIEFPEDIPPIPLDGETRYQLALGVREALTNAVRHAAASEIVLALAVEVDHLRVRVADNGRGFRLDGKQGAGQGLANMRARLEKIGGHCDCQSVGGTGTTITLEVPLPPGARLNKRVKS